MRENLKKTVEMLKDRVRINLELIHQNEREIKEILKEPVSEERSRKLDERFKANKKLLTENNDSLLIQRQINSFIDTHFNIFTESKGLLNNSSTNNFKVAEEKTKAVSRDDYIDLTINGTMEFNSNHPYYEDETFLNDLLSHFISIEDYEMCSKLTNSK